MLGSLPYTSLTLVLRVIHLGGSSDQLFCFDNIISFSKFNIFQYAVGILIGYFIYCELAVDWS